MEGAEGIKPEVVGFLRQSNLRGCDRYPLGRTFRDRLGHLTRQISAIADTVYLVTAGYALNLSQLGTPLKDISHH